ncbi:ankyrin repeat-containing domain protein [Baffinella frigidus]|nr:ankyrin repeat-containing domain protein [Cryptophyta sp. CCMP2293]
MRGIFSSLYLALALLCGCREASPALLGASLSEAFRPAPLRSVGLRCHPLLVASADSSVMQTVGGEEIGAEQKFMGGPFQILFEVGKEAAAKVRSVMVRDDVDSEEKAALKTEKEAYRQALQHYDMNQMLGAAAENGYSREIERLVRRGANPNARDDMDWYRQPPLHRAAASGHARATRKLLELGAKPNTQDWDQWTALHYAAYLGSKGHQEVADLLLAFKADIYETTWDGKVLANDPTTYL